ncbi:hypothetical protein CCHOA_09315 [Corynebacterium choanae]|uniref:Uncharacterized protein n=1 Tax=Corynebacterium choanae TaxID=1862358 RepID=A0A3G6J8D0_9CORY|nr:hypothetical protein CCHOA_09315 [Corynebacterium choanae]
MFDNAVFAGSSTTSTASCQTPQCCKHSVYFLQVSANTTSAANTLSAVTSELAPAIQHICDNHLSYYATAYTGHLLAAVHANLARQPAQHRGNSIRRGCFVMFTQHSCCGIQIGARTRKHRTWCIVSGAHTTLGIATTVQVSCSENKPLVLTLPYSAGCTRLPQATSPSGCDLQPPHLLPRQAFPPQKLQ